jgi:putative oxidoreductase
VSLGLLVLRLALAVVFARDGVQKLVAGRSGRVSPVARTLAVLELLGAALLAVGLLTWFGALLVSATVLVLVLVGVEDVRAWVPGGGYDYHLVALAAAFALAAVGPGDWSLDDAIDFDWFGAGWALLELGVAWVAAVSLVLLMRPRPEDEVARARPPG